jgi:AcrR family transcriptional regulator
VVSAKGLKEVTSKDARIEDVAFKLFLRHGFRKVRMGDIATGAGMSRPSLYAVFPNKEAIFTAIIQRYTRTNQALSEVKLKLLKGAKARLECIFELWVVDAYCMAIASENATELSTFAPIIASEATALMWATVESQIIETLRADCKNKRDPAITELGHVLVLAAKGAKAASANAAELRRMVQGLTSMTLASLERINSRPKSHLRRRPTISAKRSPLFPRGEGP